MESSCMAVTPKQETSSATIQVDGTEIRNMEMGDYSSVQMVFLNIRVSSRTMSLMVRGTWS